MNRFTWDMRYEGATVFPGMIMWAAQPQRGPAAPPGPYSVRIAANGETTSTAFEIGLDPRLEQDGVSLDDLREQFELVDSHPRQGDRGEHGGDHDSSLAGPGE